MATLESNVEMALGESFREPLAPFDHHHGIVQVGVEVQGVEFGEQIGPEWSSSR